jgi:hypothetical protein
VVGLDLSLAQPWTDHLAQSLEGVRVVTSRDIATMLGLERQKQLLGCADSSACMTELADALGVDGLLVGDVVKVGTRVQVSVRVVDPAAGKHLAAYTTQLAREQDVFDALTDAGRRLREQLLPGPTPAVRARNLFWVPLAAGAAFLGAGVGLWLWSDSLFNRLTRPSASPVPLDQAAAARSTGPVAQALSFVALGVGAAAALAGVALRLFIRDAPAIEVAPLPGGGALAGLSGALP